MTSRPIPTRPTTAPTAPPGYTFVKNAPASTTQPSPQYVYQQQSPSVVEGVLNTILNPGVNAQTYRVLSFTLVALFLVISWMLFYFDGIASEFRLHLWIFLAVCFGLILSVQWFFIRYQTYANDDDEEEEEGEDEEEEEVSAPSNQKKSSSTTAATTTAAPGKKVVRKVVRRVVEEEVLEEVEDEDKTQ